MLVYQRFELFVRGTHARSDMLPSALSVSGPSQSADPGASAFRLQSAAYVAGGIYQSWKSRKHYDLVLGFARSSHFFCFSSCLFFLIFSFYLIFLNYTKHFVH